MPEALRKFNKIHIDEDCSYLKGDHENELFFNCTFDELKGVTLKNCDLNQSKFVTSSIRDILGFTVTLDCLSFNNVQLSELVFDLMLSLLMKTKGNDVKRAKLREVIGEHRSDALQQILKATE